MIHEATPRQLDLKNSAAVHAAILELGTYLSTGKPATMNSGSVCLAKWAYSGYMDSVWDADSTEYDACTRTPLNFFWYWLTIKRGGAPGSKYSLLFNMRRRTKMNNEDISYILATILVLHSYDPNSDGSIDTMFDHAVDVVINYARTLADLSAGIEAYTKIKAAYEAANSAKDFLPESVVSQLRTHLEIAKTNRDAARVAYMYNFTLTPQILKHQS